MSDNLITTMPKIQDIIANVFLAVANFVFDGRATYEEMLAVFWYSILPLTIPSLLVCALPAISVNVESFPATNPIGINAGYDLSEGTSPTLMAALSMVDLF